MKVKPVNSRQIKACLLKMAPYFMSHGGMIKFISWQARTGVVKVKLAGACQNCPMSNITLRYGVERLLRQELPQVKKVEVVPLVSRGKVWRAARLPSAKFTSQ